MDAGDEDRPSDGETILLVEDNPAYIRLVRELLRDAGLERFDLEWVDLLEKGIDRLEAGGVDLILLDLLLPDNMGTNTLEVVLENAPKTPVIVLTGIDDDELAREALDLGAVDYLCKGRLDADRLARSIRYALSSESSEPDGDPERTFVGLERLLPATASQLDRAADLLSDVQEHLDPLADPDARERIESDSARFATVAQSLDEIVDLAGSAPDREQLSLHEVLDEALVRVSGEEGVGGRVRLDWARTPRLFGDRRKLVRLFDLLLSHVMATDGQAPHELRIDAQQDGDRWEVHIHDPGRRPDGADPLDALFDVEKPPDRAHGPVARTLCEAIVASVGGRIWVQPRTDGEGTVLCLSLPSPRVNGSHVDGGHRSRAEASAGGREVESPE